MRPILIIEDNEDDVMFLQRGFKKVGVEHPLHFARDGREALEYLGRVAQSSDRIQDPVPILIFLDLQLPHIAGLDVLKWIRSQQALRTVIVIVHTSSHLDVDIERAYEWGANSFLVKTPSSAKLLEMMRTVKAYWLELNAMASTRPQALDRSVPSGTLEL